MQRYNQEEEESYFSDGSETDIDLASHSTTSEINRLLSDSHVFPRGLQRGVSHDPANTQPANTQKSAEEYLHDYRQEQNALTLEYETSLGGRNSGYDFNYYG